VAVTNYDVYRNGTLAGTVPAPTVTFTDTGLVRGTAYTYTITARDAAGNTSSASTATSVTSLTRTVPCVSTPEHPTPRTKPRS